MDDSRDDSRDECAERCPLCGQANGCALAAGDRINECWCVSAEISPEARRRAGALGGAPRCLCPRCGASAPATVSAKEK